MKGRLVTLAFLVFMLGGAPAKAADAVPAATGFVSCLNADGSSTDDPSGCSAAYDSGTRTLSPDASLTGQANYPGDFAPVSAGVFGATDYYFTVVGPDTGAALPIDINASLNQSTINGAYAFSEIIATAGTDIFHEPNSATGLICSDCADQSTSLEDTLHIFTEVGLISSVHLEIEAAAGFAADANSAQASVDPFIYVDPGFTDASAYSILLSPGVGNVLSAAVPEPTTWAMMIVGMALVSGAMRRRQQPAIGF